MKRNSKSSMIVPTLSMTLFAILIASAPVSAGTVAGAPTLAMMGGGGGHMMGGQGYGPNGWGGHMGTGRGWFSGQDRYRGDYGDNYRRTERDALRQELRQERRKLSDMVRSGNTDPDRIDRKMDRIERLERQLYGPR